MLIFEETVIMLQAYTSLAMRKKTNNTFSRYFS